MIPREVIGLIAATKEKLDDLVQQNVTSATDATNEGRKELSSMGLPGAVETHKTGGQLPENLWMKAQRMQTMGGLGALQARYSRL